MITTRIKEYRVGIGGYNLINAFLDKLCPADWQETKNSFLFGYEDYSVNVERQRTEEKDDVYEQLNITITGKKDPYFIKSLEGLIKLKTISKKEIEALRDAKRDRERKEYERYGREVIRKRLSK